MLDLAIKVGLEEMGLRSRTAFYVEREAFACTILGDRGEQEAVDAAPLYPSLAGFDGRPFRGLVDLIVAGLPCQPYSVAGKRQGNTDRRSFGEGDGPIVHALRIIEEVEPALVFLENVPAWVAARDQWFRPVGERLSDLGYRIEKPLFLAARDVGASHERERVFILAHRLDDAALGVLRERGRQSDATLASGREDVAHCSGGGFGELRHASGLERRRQSDRDAEELANAGRERDGAHESLSIGGGRDTPDDCARSEELENTARHGGDRPLREGRGRRRVCEAGRGLGNSASNDGANLQRGSGTELSVLGTSGCQPPLGSPSGAQRAWRCECWDGRFEAPGFGARKQLAAHEPDGRTDGRTDGAGIMPTNFRIS